MSYSPRMISASWRTDEEDDLELKEKFKGKTPSEALEEIKEGNRLDLD